MAELSHRRQQSTAIMGDGHGRVRYLNQPAGGLWAWAIGPLSPELCIAVFTRAHPEFTDWDWWLLEPEPEAQIVVIDGAEDLAAALDRWPYRTAGARGDRLEIDFPAVRAEGFAAVHFTEAAAEQGLPLMRSWETGATCWLRWAFVGTPERVTERALSEGDQDVLEQITQEKAGGEG